MTDNALTNLVPVLEQALATRQTGVSVASRVYRNVEPETDLSQEAARAIVLLAGVLQSSVVRVMARAHSSSRVLNVLCSLADGQTLSVTCSSLPSATVPDGLGVLVVGNHGLVRSEGDPAAWDPLATAETAGVCENRPEFQILVEAIGRSLSRLEAVVVP